MGRKPKAAKTEKVVKTVEKARELIGAAVVGD